MTKYKEMYEWEKASHYATEKELDRFKKMYAELFEKYSREVEELTHEVGIWKTAYQSYIENHW